MTGSSNRRDRQDWEGYHSSCLPFYGNGMGTNTRNLPKWRKSGAMHLCTRFTKVIIKIIENHQKATGFTYILEIIVALCYRLIYQYDIMSLQDDGRFHVENKNN